MPFVDVHGVRTRYRESGAERAGTPLVFLHGAGGSSVTWLGTLRSLGRTRRCLAPDLPGHGQSGPFPGGTASVSIEAYRAFVDAYCAALDMPRAVLVGHSMGGAIAIEAALGSPNRVAGLVLIATAARLAVSAAVFDAIDNHFGQFPEMMAMTGFSPSTPRDQALRLSRAGLQAPQAVVRADFEACNRWDARERIAAISAPTLVMIGEDDLLAPAKYGRFLADRIPGARVVAFPRTGHMVHLERQGEVVEALSSTVPCDTR
ncbi:MAG: alpha/beta fold hydrolase [Deltaproteobacteria bacterium]|nr:alpha/beta fold hydrolase [Deltaproteobacteria bacterium]